MKALKARYRAWAYRRKLERAKKNAVDALRFVDARMKALGYSRQRRNQIMRDLCNGREPNL